MGGLHHQAYSNFNLSLSQVVFKTGFNLYFYPILNYLYIIEFFLLFDIVVRCL